MTPSELASSKARSALDFLDPIPSIYSRCSSCPGKNNVVPPSGPARCDILLCGESPGKLEDQKKTPFIGPTGKELNDHYLRQAGLLRPNVRVTNAIACLPPGPDGKLDSKRTADIEMLNSCAKHHLYPEITRCQPQLIVAMGVFACRALDPAINLELHHGIPLQTQWGPVIPMYHPSQGMHEPKRMLLLRNDWIRLKKYLAGSLRIREDEYAGREDYRLIESERHLSDSFSTYSGGPMACDTESTRDHDPFCLTYSINPGSGFLIKSDAVGILSAFQDILSGWTSPIFFHNWLYDIHVTNKMSLQFPRKRIVDTMQLAFHLGNLPQGLKALSYRELGMNMQDFDDLVRPHSTPLVIDYYREAYMEDWPKPEPFTYRDKDGEWKVKSPQSMKTKLKRFFTDYSKNPEKDPFSMWHDNWEEHHREIEEKMGRYPGLCITHVPFDEVLYYSIRDADATLRLGPRLLAARKLVRRIPQENWMDAA